ncbi:MAG: DUF882 domain-containing protein [Gammaproteobacteria bacterium]|nr:DUF882 domain-containing protein [Gammaproteobacteria bacterium]
MTHRTTRRQILKAAIALPTTALSVPGFAAVDNRRLRFLHTHTSEKLDVTYMEAGQYLPDALEEINALLRDFRSGEVYPIEPQLLDLLHGLQIHASNDREFQIISAYRSPKTNAMLRQNGGGVAKRSLHMQGKAIDIRLPGTPIANLRQAALDLRAGGVGFYPESDFIHVDTGRVRQW